jgi:vancomycin resistance protein YoaR
VITDQAPVEAPESASRRRRGRSAGYAAAGLLALAPLAWAADVALSGETVAAGVQVGDPADGVPVVDVGGLAPAAAERALAAAYGPVAASPVRVGVDGEEVDVDPSSAGLSFDAAATVAAALDPGWLPWRRWQARFGTLTVDPVTRGDEPLLTAALHGLGAAVEPPVVHAAVVYDGLEPQAREPRDGRALDVPAARHELRERWLSGRLVPLPVVEVPARGSAKQVQAALDEEGRSAVAAPVVFDVEGRDVEVAPEELAPHLVLEVGEDGRLVPVVDGGALREELREGLAGVEQVPVDATFATEGESVRVVPSSTGRTLPVAVLADAVESVVLAPPPRRVPVDLVGTEPELTTAEAEALGVAERISTYTSEHPCCQPRVRNIHRIADLLDGHLVLPGEEFGLNQVVGPRTRDAGFVAAPQISEGRFTDGVGGGISQFVTAMFNAVFFAGLEDVQHTPHSYYISRYSPGRESTVSYPEPDFRFRNDGDAAVLVDTSYTDRSITVSFYGTKRYDVQAVQGPRRNTTSYRTIYDPSSDCEPMSGGNGFDVTVTRVFSRAGVEVRREDFETTYKAQPRVLCSPPPRAAQRPSASPSPSPRASSPSPAPAEPSDETTTDDATDAADADEAPA